MTEETPRPMRRVRRDLFHRVGKSLKFLEQDFSQSSFHRSRDSLSSFDGSSPHAHSNTYDDDQISFEYSQTSETESPRIITQHRHGIIDEGSRSMISLVLFRPTIARTFVVDFIE